jgi:hypothetical protein
MAKRQGHGESEIYQRESDGKWCASIDLGFVNGKRQRKVVYGKTRKEVADKLVLGEARPVESPSFAVDPAVERRIRVRSQMYAFLCQLARHAELPAELHQELPEEQR